MQLRAVGRKKEERPLFHQEPGCTLEDGTLCTFNVHFYDCRCGKPVPKYEMIQGEGSDWNCAVDPHTNFRTARACCDTHLSFMSIDSALNNYRIIYAIQGQVPAEVAQVTWTRLKRHHVASGSHKD